jgi:flavorubredoxin
MQIFIFLIFSLILNRSLNIIPFDLEEGIKYIGVNDHYEHYIHSIEGPNPVPNGSAYNSYVIIDEKIIIIDGIHEFYQNKWLENLNKALQGRVPDFILIQHMEPDHSGNLDILIKLFPNIKIISTSKSFLMMKNFFNNDYNNSRLIVKEGDEINLGKHKLHFIEAPMVHWPEVVLTYDSYTKSLFSCDAFGKFGANDIDEPWDDEARRFYFGILSKYGKYVQYLLNKLSKFEIKNIYPGHGPILTENISHYFNLYEKWSKYIPEEEGVVIVYSSIYGHTKVAVDILAEKLKALNIKYIIHNLSFSDISKVISDAFRYTKLVIASITYHNGIYPFVRRFLNHLISKNYQSRFVAYIENYSWEPNNGAELIKKLKNCKNINLFYPIISINSSVKSKDIEKLNELVEKLSK